MSEAEGAVKVEEWQQMFYALDSGIQSGANTIRDEDESEFSKKYSGSASAGESATGNVLSKGLHSPLRNILMNYTTRGPLKFHIRVSGIEPFCEGCGVSQDLCNIRNVFFCLFWDSAFLDIKSAQSM